MPTIHLGFVPLFVLALSLPACASMTVEQQVEQMEKRQSENRLLEDLRFAMLEKRLAILENTVEAVRTQLAERPRRRSARRSALPPRTIAPPERPAPLVASATPGEPLPQAAKPVAPSPATQAAAPSTAAKPASPSPAPVAPAATPAPSPAPQAAPSPSPSPEPARSKVSAAVAHATPPEVAAPEAPRVGPVAEQSSPAPAVKKPAPSAPKSAGLARPDRDARAAYDDALALYYKGQYVKSEEAFDEFLERYPATRLTPNALYWQGECFYSLGKFDTAILSFKDVAGKFPKHDKAAASLLKAGYAYAELGDMENARFYWRILLDDFPASTPAKLARRRLEGR
jgi:tol-pal system protein YbgF